MILWLPSDLTNLQKFKKSVRALPQVDELLAKFFAGADEQILLGFHFVLQNSADMTFSKLINVVVTGLLNLKYLKKDTVRHIVPVILPVEIKGRPARWYSIDEDTPGVNLSIIKPEHVVDPPPPSNGTFVTEDDIPDDDSLVLQAGSLFPG